MALHACCECEATVVKMTSRFSRRATAGEADSKKLHTRNKKEDEDEDLMMKENQRREGGKKPHRIRGRMRISSIPATRS